MKPLTRHARQALARKLLLDLDVSQSTADSCAGRLKIDAATAAYILDELVRDGLAETATIELPRGKPAITVYLITTAGLDLLS